jgi:hypothetical protein
MNGAIGTIDDLQIEPLSDDVLESVAGAGTSSGCVSSTGPACCSCSNCSNGGETLPGAQTDGLAAGL